MKTATLSEIVETWGGLIQTGPFGSQLHQHEYSEEGIPVVMPKDIRNGRVDESSIARVPETKANQLSRHFLKAGSVVFPRRGEIGKCAYVSEDQAGFLCGTGCIKIEPPEEKLRSKFLFYFLNLRQSVEWLERNAIGTTMLNLNTKILGNLQIPLLEPKKQDEIVDLLSVYDDLIENNRRRITLLEQAARLLYREWFVRLHFPGHEHTKIINGMPEGWTRRNLGKIATIRKGKNITKETIKVGNVPVVAGGLTPAYYHDEANVLGPVITVSASGANAGYVALYHQDIWASDCSYLSIADNPEIWYLYLMLQSRQTEIFGMQQGAAQPHVYPKHLMRLSLLYPSSSLRNFFSETVKASFSQIANLQRMIDRLTKARDLLLPKLMSREVAI